MKTYSSSRKSVRDAACAKSFGRRFCSAVLVMIFAFVAISFVSCTPETAPNLDTKVELQGKWIASESEYYEIKFDTFDNGYYAGNNLVVKYTSDNSGYIYFKYTKAFCLAHSDIKEYPEPSVYAYDEDGSDVGKWYAVSFKNLTSKSISISGAYKYDGKSSTETLEEAITEFTIENGYFATYSECVKQ